ncbi:MAG: sensor domain-containing diguanylate cyclase [Acidimicrobiia bacterium]|nr:sensor domain-containing diguanylate cyclase [Acidimicrobiia bacterium]
MNRDGPLAGDYLVKAFEALLAQHPTAPVAAIDDHGLYAPVPDSIDLGSHAVVPGRSALDLVVPADRVVVIDAWERGREQGAARASVRLRGSPDRAVVMELFDLRKTHGVLMVVVVGADTAAELIGLSDVPPIAPRLAVQRKNDVAVIIAVDEPFTQMLGWRPEEAIGAASLDMVHPEDQDRAIETWMEMLAVPGSTRRVRLRHRRSDGSWLWVEITNRNLLDDPDERCVVAEVIDVSDEVAAHEAVRAREQLLRRIAETIPMGLVQVDRDGRVVYSNERFCDIMGSGPADKLQDLLHGVVREEWVGLEEAIDDVLVSGRDVDMEVRLQDQRRGRDRQCRFSLRALTAGSSITGAILCVEDVTESARMRVELERRATYDDLTRCLNRRSVMAALEDALAGDGRVGIVFMDLDDFKEVNDALGHAVGDELLVAVADRLRAVVREGDVVGRLGGDEFLVVCPGCDDPEEVLAIARRVEAANRDALVLGSAVIAARLSIGVAVSGPSSGPDAVVADADMAMYESKRRGAGEAVLFSESLRDAAGTEPRSMHVRRR